MSPQYIKLRLLPFLGTQNLRSKPSSLFVLRGLENEVLLTPMVYGLLLNHEAMEQDYNKLGSMN